MGSWAIRTNFALGDSGPMGPRRSGSLVLWPFRPIGTWAIRADRVLRVHWAFGSSGLLSPGPLVPLGHELFRPIGPWASGKPCPLDNIDSMSHSHFDKTFHLPWHRGYPERRIAHWCNGMGAWLGIDSSLVSGSSCGWQRSRIPGPGPVQGPQRCWSIPGLVSHAQAHGPRPKRFWVHSHGLRPRPTGPVLAPRAWSNAHGPSPLPKGPVTGPWAWSCFSCSIEVIAMQNPGACLCRIQLPAYAVSSRLSM